MNLSVINWDPNQIFFTIPYINHPVAWYGLLFAFGFFLGYLFLLKEYSVLIDQNPSIVSPTYKSYSSKEIAQIIVDKLAWTVVIAVIVGARLGHVFLYDWAFYKDYPIEILKIWKGGLASHGAAVGIILSLFLFYRMAKNILPGLKLSTMFDLFCVPVPLGGCLIRIGNFINQEIVGTPSTLPWAVSFGHPLDGPSGIPLHPVQLYESAAYLLIFAFLFRLLKTGTVSRYPGAIVGWALTLIFGSRFVLEFFKTHQYSIMDANTMQMGQLLSLPFVAAGIIILITSYKKSDHIATKHQI